MSTRSLRTLAHALGVEPDLQGALVALGDALADGDRTAVLGLLRYDGSKEMLRERLTPVDGKVERAIRHVRVGAQTASPWHGVRCGTPGGSGARGAPGVAPRRCGRAPHGLPGPRAALARPASSVDLEQTGCRAAPDGKERTTHADAR